MKATKTTDRFAITEITTAGLRETRGIISDGQSVIARIEQVLAEPIEIGEVGDPWVRDRLLAAKVVMDSIFTQLDCELPRG